MKAVLVYSEFVTRVVVADDATEEQILAAARTKCLSQVLQDFSENVTETKPDTEDEI